MNWLLRFLKGLWPWGRGSAPPPEPRTEPPAERVEPPPPVSAVEIEAPPTPESIPEPSPPVADAEIIGHAVSDGETAVADEAEAAADELEDEDPEDDEEAEEQWEAEDEDLLEPDPFITSEQPLIEPVSRDEIAVRRARSMARALEGDHRVYLSEAAGPGSLGEALNILLKAERVTASFHEDPEEGPFIQYTAKTYGDAPAEGAAPGGAS